MKHHTKRINILTAAIMLLACPLTHVKLPKQQPRDTMEEIIARMEAEGLQRQEQLTIALQELTTNLYRMPVDQNQIATLLNRHPNLITDETIVTAHRPEYTYAMYATTQRDIGLVRLFMRFSRLGQPTRNFSNFFDFLVQQNFDSEQNREFLNNLGTLLENRSRNIIAPLLSSYNERGHTPLFQAMLHPSAPTRLRLFTLIRILGADINEPNAHGFAPIFIAIAKNDRNLIAEFVRNGANLAVTNPQGTSARSLLSEELWQNIEEHIRFFESTRGN